jgi:uncharacterized protein with ATP-grasp and redox domains
MISTPKCLSCYIDDILGALDMLGISANQTTSILQEVLLYLSTHIKDDVPPSYHITDLHRIIKKHLGLTMPFAEARRASLEASMQIAKLVQKEASDLGDVDMFGFLLKWAVASNSLDFRTAGAGYNLSVPTVEKTLRSYFDKGLTVSETEDIYSVCKTAKNIVYIPDNVGELPFDKLLIHKLRTMGANVTVPMRGGPITSDATMTDALDAGIQDVATSVILAGPDTLGISFMEMSEELALALSRADVIIAKGQANYYVLSEYGEQYDKATIIALFTAKCSHVWQQFGCREKASIAAIIKENKTFSGIS